VADRITNLLLCGSGVRVDLLKLYFDEYKEEYRYYAINNIKPFVKRTI
jgi:hypothetical protein